MQGSAGSVKNMGLKLAENMHRESILEWRSGDISLQQAFHLSQWLLSFLSLSSVLSCQVLFLLSLLKKPRSGVARSSISQPDFVMISWHVHVLGCSGLWIKLRFRGTEQWALGEGAAPTPQKKTTTYVLLLALLPPCVCCVMLEIVFSDMFLIIL